MKFDNTTVFITTGARRGPGPVFAGDAGASEVLAEAFAREVRCDPSAEPVTSLPAMNRTGARA